MPCCVSLESGRRAAARKHVHLCTDAWEVTSDVPPEEVGVCNVLERTFPGVLGRYFFPRDAVLKTAAASLEAVLHDEREQLRMAAEAVALNHISVERAEEEAEEVEEALCDEEEEGDDEEEGGNDEVEDDGEDDDEDDKDGDAP